MLRSTKFSIGKDQFNIDNVGIAEMNFGQLNRHKQTELISFKIQITKNHFISNLKPFFENLAEESRKEQSTGIKNEIEELNEYINLGFPKVESLLDDYPFAFSALMDVFGYDVLIEFFSTQRVQEKPIRHLIVFVESFEVMEAVEVTGLCIDLLV